MKLTNAKRHISAPGFFIFSALFAVSPVFSESSIREKFDYKGDMLFRGFFLSRDLPLEKQDEGLCSKDEFLAYFMPITNGNTKSPCKESDDYYQARFRLDSSFRPNSYADIVYGLEVGHLTFGRDNPESSGPGSGGKGNASNLETRQLFLKLHNLKDTVSIRGGLFPIGTPKGIVLASSGAGVQLSLEGKYSSLEASYIRKEDNSRIDNDSNGFSDSNFHNVHMGILSWKFSGLSWLKTDTYFVHRRDGDPSDEGDDDNETSAISWAGLLMQFRYKKFTFLLHGIYNAGTFKRPFYFYPSLDEKFSLFPDIKFIHEEALRIGYPLRSKHRVNAGAGEMEMSYQLLDSTKVTLMAAGASGRPGIEPNGDPVDYRRDQFRTAGSAYQGSDIALDSSGGYSIFPLGKLTGVVQRGIRIDIDILQNLSYQIAYYTFDAFRTPTITYNDYYELYMDTNKTDNRLGEEWNMKLTWKIMTLLSLDIRAARFDSQTGYKILYDIEYGDVIYEASASLTQKF
ncbi:MAG: hypothetical protein OEZ34_01455 [Spirochaetia bacterium]|nr:hypothetical protein [Spirochaetia bacterium]